MHALGVPPPAAALTMPVTPAAHLHRTDAALRRLLRLAAGCDSASLAAASHALGLHEQVARALQGWNRPQARGQRVQAGPGRTAGRANPATKLTLLPHLLHLSRLSDVPHLSYTLHLDAACPAHAWPRALLSPIDGSLLPVRVQCSANAPAAHSRVATLNQTHSSGPGSLTAVLRADPPGVGLYALSAGHVWAGMSSTAIDDRISIDIGAGTPIVGSLLEWAPRFGQIGARAAIDAAIARVIPTELEGLVARQDWWPTGSASVRGDDLLRLRTRDIEIHGGLASMGDARLRTGLGVADEYIVEDAVWWRPQQRTEHGDSGAPIWNDSGQLVALHAGGTTTSDGVPWAIAIPIDRVLVWARATVVAGGEALWHAPLPRQDLASDLVFTPSAQPVAPPTADAASDILARTLWGEARGEGWAGMQAVAHVVYNRVAARSWWGRDVVAVCRKPWQFSCWNVNDPNSSRLRSLSAADGLFNLALEAARSVAAAELAGTRRQPGADPTDGATHYYAPHAVATPKWARGRQPCARIGRHLFFRGVA